MDVVWIAISWIADTFPDLVSLLLLCGGLVALGGFALADRVADVSARPVNRHALERGAGGSESTRRALPFEHE